jgi:hypothetical protein
MNDRSHSLLISVVHVGAWGLKTLKIEPKLVFLPLSIKEEHIAFQINV